MPYGIIADKYINQINEFYVNINVDKYVIMPDHMHILLSVTDNGAPRTSPPTRQTATVPHFVSTFKRFCNKEIGENIWQRGYYDHVIRNRQDYDEVWEYVENNPLKWALIHRI
ncbi:MAG: transposase [Clostridia bacterium]|nr:transposase [Clostridia bacterium]